MLKLASRLKSGKVHEEGELESSPNCTTVARSDTLLSRAELNVQEPVSLPWTGRRKAIEYTARARCQVWRWTGTTNLV